MSYSEIKGTRTEREILEDEVKSLQLALQTSRFVVAEDEDTSEDDDDDSSQGRNRKYNLSTVCPGHNKILHRNLTGTHRKILHTIFVF